MLGKKNYKALSIKWLKKRLPILTWLPNYQRSYIPSDIIAGITVGLTAVPQSMAYATVAGLSPEYGLYSSFMGCFLYVIFGSCKQMTVFPTALTTLMAFNICGDEYPSCVALTAFYVGLIQVSMAFLQFGTVVSLISEPVTIGFTGGAALTVAVSQIKNLLGLKGPKGNGFIDKIGTIIKNFPTISPGDATVGVLCILSLTLLQRLKELKFDGPLLKKVLWYVSVSRNAIVVVMTSVIAFAWGNPPFILTGTVMGGLPDVAIPQFELPEQECAAGNSTITTCPTMDFWSTWGLLRHGPFVLAAVAVLSNVAIAKSFGSGKTVDGTQEMFALGMIQICGSFFGSIPNSGSFSRSAINEASGVRSTLGGVFSGLLVLLSLGFLTPTFYYIPKASLAAVIISAVLSLIEYEALQPMWKISKLDVAACLVTFASSALLGMEYGILVGVGASIITLLAQSVRPTLPIELKTQDDVQYYLLRPEERLNFPSVDFIQTKVNKLVTSPGTCRAIVLDLGKLISLDYSAATALSNLTKALKKHNYMLMFLNVKAEFMEILEIAGLTYPSCYDKEEDVVKYLKDHSRKRDGNMETSYINMASSSEDDGF